MNRHFLKAACSGIAVITLIAPAATAQNQKMDIRPLANQVTGDDLQSFFKGTTHDGAYNFSRDGKAQARYIETHSDNGNTLYVENGDVTEGIWFIKKDTLCFAYDSPSMNGGCFRVYKVKNCFYYYSNNIPRRTDELERNYWVARSTLKGERPECEAAIS